MKKYSFVLVLLALLTVTSVTQASADVYAGYDFSGMITSATGIAGVSSGQAYTGSIFYNTSAFAGSDMFGDYYNGPLQMSLTIGGTSYNMANILRSTALPDSSYLQVGSMGPFTMINTYDMKNEGSPFMGSEALRSISIDTFPGGGLYALLDVHDYFGSQITQVELVKLEGTVTDMHRTPIPGAIWLFGSGLAGLAGLRRKFKKA